MSLPSGPSLRASPTQRDGFFSSANNAWKAFFGSTQKMTPQEAIQHLVNNAKAVYLGEEAPVFKWLDRVNRLLWVLTHNGDFLLENEDDRHYILYILSISSTLYADSGSKPKNCLDFAKNDPRSDLTYEEVLLQVQGRCRLLENLYINVHSAKQRIEELSGQLKGTSEEEKRLAEKYKNAEKMAALIKAEYEKKIAAVYEECGQEMEKVILENQALKDSQNRIKSDHALLKMESKSHMERCYQLSLRVEELERELEKKSKIIPQQEIEIVSEIVYSHKDLEEIRYLRKENSSLKEEVAALMQEREDVLYQRESLIKRAHALQEKQTQETETKANQKLSAIKAATQEADASFKAHFDNPLSHSETLDKLLGKIEEIIKK